MTAGIFGGSFNPVHNGHIILAKALVGNGLVDEVWLTLSPLNPLKANPSELVSDIMRLDMLHLAAHGVPGLRVCDIELSLPRPSYTINTLRALSAAYPSTDFRLVIGSDNYPPIVYPRPGYPCPGTIDLPQYDISSTIIRERLCKGESVDGMLPPQVINYISRHGLYR